MLTMRDFETFGSFDAMIYGESLPVEVSVEIYDYFLGCLPPVESGPTRADFINLPIPVQGYFLVGEPYTHIGGKPAYACFARAYDDKYFFLGYLHKEKSLLERETKEERQDWVEQAKKGEVMRIM